MGVLPAGAGGSGQKTPMEAPAWVFCFQLSSAVLTETELAGPDHTG